MDLYVLVFLAYVVGALFRTVYAYLWKLLEDPDLSFDRKFWITMLTSMVLTIIVASTTFMGVVEQIPDTPESQALLFFMFVSLGYAMNDVVNRAVTYLSKKKTG